MHVCMYLPTYLSHCVLPIFSWTCGLPLDHGKLNILLIYMFISCPQLLSGPPLPPKHPTSCSLSILKTLLIQFVLVNYSWTLRLTWSRVNIASVSSLKETDFLSQQQPNAISPSARHGTSCPPFFSTLGFCLAEVYAGLLHVVTIAVSSCTPAPQCLGNIVFS